MTTALLVIDMQQALCAGDEAAFGIEAVTDRINGLGRAARAAGAPVVLVQHQEDDGPLQAGTDGWQLAQGLHTAAADLRLRKTACDSFHETELHALLQERGVRHLVVCGLQSDFCVDATVRRALSLGYDVTLAADAHSTVDNGVLTAAQITAHHNRTLASMRSYGRRVEAVPAHQVRFATAGDLPRHGEIG
ncbi:MAG: cysteine hydrolase family protein [Ramlibacter sp.]